MISARDDSMGRFSVEVELANYADVARQEAGDLPRDRVRKTVVHGVVDTGAAWLVIPESAARQLGLRPTHKTRVTYADQRTVERDVVLGVALTYAGRTGLFRAIIEPQRESALIGAIVLEDLDLVVDCLNQKLVPRDPRIMTSIIE